MKKVLVLFLFVAGLFTIVGCSSLPPPEKMQSDTADFILPKLPEPGKAIVYVVRPTWYVGGAFRFSIFVDDKEVDSEMGYTKGGQYTYFNLTPGEHTIFSKAYNWADMKVSVKENDIIYILQEVKVGAMKAYNQLILPPDYQGKYHVKHLKLGKIIKTDK